MYWTDPDFFYSLYTAVQGHDIFEKQEKLRFSVTNNMQLIKMKLLDSKHGMYHDDISH